MAKPKIRNLPDLTYLAQPGQEIALRVTPSSAQSRLTREGDTLRVSVTSPAENGKANAATRALLAKAMGVAPSRLTLKRGQTSRDKLFVFDGN